MVGIETLVWAEAEFAGSLCLICPVSGARLVAPTYSHSLPPATRRASPS